MPDFDDADGSPGYKSINVLSVYASSALTLIIAGLHFLLFRAAQQFADVYAGFGAELPWLTELMFPGSLYYFTATLLLSLCYVLHHLGYLSRAMTLLITSVGSFASISLVIIGLYLPIFQLGAVVGSQ